MADAIVIERQNVNLFHSCDMLAVTLGPAYGAEFLEGKRLFIVISETQTVEVRVTKAVPAHWGRHNWFLDIECDRVEELREALTYKVAGWAEIVPEYEGERCSQATS